MEGSASGVPFLGLNLLRPPACPAHLAPAWGPALPGGEGLIRFRKTQQFFLLKGGAQEGGAGGFLCLPPPLLKLSQD